eukprot:Tbor_TRINITY_DN5346_c4_g1::TRINITY_DN5346_c4_g1_i5::g.4195::m.4195
MVRLDPQEFHEASSRMNTLIGVNNTKLLIKIKKKKIYITNNDINSRTVLNSIITKQSEMSTLINIIEEYINRCVTENINNIIKNDNKNNNNLNNNNNNNNAEGNSGGGQKKESENNNNIDDNNNNNLN